MALLTASVAVLATSGVAAGATDTTVPPAEAPSGELETVRLANFGHLPATLPYDYALANDLFEANGVEIAENPAIFNAAEAIQTLFTGDADVGYIGISAPIQGVEVGRDVRVIGVVAGKFPLEVALTNETLEELEANGVTVDSSIEDKVAALEGLTLASPAAGSTTDLVFRYAVDKYGLDPDSDLTIQPVGDAAAIVAAARQGAVDGVIATTGGPSTLAESEGFAQVFINFAEQDPDLGQLPIHVLVTSTDYLEEHPEAVEGVVNAFYQARQAIEAGLSPEELVALKETVAPDMEQGLWDTTIEQILPLFTGSMAVTPEQYDISVAVVDIGADTPTTATFEEVVDNSVVEAIGAS
jgi:NitT/TauT family transport system substrate-binding protein